jgi:acyl-CoA synthetase (AMP-forming)/AMP-acid ligase II
VGSHVQRATTQDEIPGTVQAVRRHALNSPTSIALHDLATGRRIDYREFDLLVDAACQYLASVGLRAGDRVALVLDNSIEFCLLFLASLRYGTIANPHPYMFIAAEIAADLEETPPAVTLVARDRLSEFEHRSTGGSAVVGVPPGDDFIETLRALPLRAVPRLAGKKRTACLYPSCGAGEDARGILYSHANLLALIPSICRGFRYGSADVHLVLLPLAHTAALNYSLLPAWSSGATVVLARGFWPIRNDFWDVVFAHRITRVQVVPTILVMLMHLAGRPHAGLALPHVGCGSAPLPLHVQLGFEDTFGLRVANLYGLSETGPTHVDDPEGAGWTAGSIGVPLDVNEVVILDEEGSPCADGREGEIAVRGANVFEGYAVNPAAAAGCFACGFFRTGDLGYRDPRDGRHYFTRRRKRLIIKGAINIHPSEIDRVMLHHPDIASVSTTGTPDDYLGEVVTTVVRVREGSRVTEEELRAHCRQRLSPLKVPDILRIERA